MVDRIESKEWLEKRNAIRQKGFVTRINNNDGLLFLFAENMEDILPIDRIQKYKQELNNLKIKSMFQANDYYSLRQYLSSIEDPKLYDDVSYVIEKHEHRRVILRKILRKSTGLLKLTDSDLSLVTNMRESEKLIFDHYIKSSLIPYKLETILYKTLLSIDFRKELNTIYKLCHMLAPFFSLNKLLDLVNFVQSFITWHSFTINSDYDKFVALWEDPSVAFWQHLSNLDIAELKQEYGIKVRLNWISKYGYALNTQKALSKQVNSRQQ